MPTTRPRYQVTETETVSHALDVASREWPDEPRSKLLLRLVAVGSEALEASQSEKRLARLLAIEATRGKYSDAFDADYLADLRKDWPA